MDFGFGLQNPKSPKSKIQNPKSPKSKIHRQTPKFGTFGASHKELLHNDPKSKIQKPQNPKFGDFGDFGSGGFKILDFGFGEFWILDLGILDPGDFGFWGFWIFGIWGRSRGCTTRQFGDGAWRSEARIPPGPPLGATSKPTVSDRVGAREKIELNDYMLHSLELISRCLHACFGFYCNITIQIPNAKPTLSDTVGKG